MASRSTFNLPTLFTSTGISCTFRSLALFDTEVSSTALIEKPFSKLFYFFNFIFLFFLFVAAIYSVYRPRKNLKAKKNVVHCLDWHSASTSGSLRSRSLPRSSTSLHGHQTILEIELRRIFLPAIPSFSKHFSLSPCPSTRPLHFHPFRPPLAQVHGGNSREYPLCLAYRKSLSKETAFWTPQTASELDPPRTFPCPFVVKSRACQPRHGLPPVAILIFNASLTPHLSVASFSLRICPCGSTILVIVVGISICINITLPRASRVRARTV